MGAFAWTISSLLCDLDFYRGVETIWRWYVTSDSWVGLQSTAKMLMFYLQTVLQPFHTIFTTVRIISLHILLYYYNLISKQTLCCPLDAVWNFTKSQIIQPLFISLKTMRWLIYTSLSDICLYQKITTRDTVMIAVVGSN